jgi:multidrug efflux pump subunit AcrB
VLVRGANGERIRLGDVAAVEDSHEGCACHAPRRAAGGQGQHHQAGRCDYGGDGAQRRAPARELAPAFPAGLTYKLLENQADYIVDSMKGVRNTALEALALVVLVLFLFLGSPRQVLIIAIALPFALLVNFFVMRLAGFSLNIFSLGGLVVAIGVLPDTSIIVVENITRLRGLRRGEPVAAVAEAGTREVGGAILAATVTFIALFSPFLLVPGMITLLFRELVLVILGLMVIAGVAAITLTPMLGSVFLRAGHNDDTWSERFNRRLQAGYGWLLQRALRARVLALLVFFGLAALGVVLFQRAGAAAAMTGVVVKVRMPAGAALERMDAINRGIEALVADDPRVAAYFTLPAVRCAVSTPTRSATRESGHELVPPSRRDLSTAEFIDELRPRSPSCTRPAPCWPSIRRRCAVSVGGSGHIEVEIMARRSTCLFNSPNDIAGESAASAPNSPTCTCRSTTRSRVAGGDRPAPGRRSTG